MCPYVRLLFSHILISTTLFKGYTQITELQFPSEHSQVHMKRFLFAVVSALSGFGGGREKYLLTMHTALVLRGDLKTAHTMESETTTVLWITMRMLVSSATQICPCALTLSTWLVA